MKKTTTLATGLVLLLIVSTLITLTKAADVLLWRDDFNYNTLVEMRSAGWVVGPDHLVSVGGGELTLVNNGAEGPHAGWAYFPAGVNDFTIEIAVEWIGGSYGSFYLTIDTERHSYCWGGNGYYPNFVYTRDTATERLSGYSPMRNVWMIFVFEKKGNTINLYWNGNIIKTSNEPDPTSSLKQISFTSGWISTNNVDYISATVPPPLKICASVEIDPETLNLRSKGKWITAYIELPEGYDVNDINVSSIVLNDTIPAVPKPTAIGDYDSDGIPDLMVKFDRAEVISYILDNIDIEEGFTTVTLTITGYLYDGTPFQGSDTIKIIYDGRFEMLMAHMLRYEKYMQRF